MTEEDRISYPNIKQAWGIVGICILTMIVFSPVSLLLNSITGNEHSFLIYYLLSMGSAFFIANFNRKKWTGVSDYNFGFSTGKIMILISVAVIALQIGVIVPIVNLIPMPEFMEKIFLEFSKRNGIFSFMAIVIAAPVLEELIFRGIILDGFLKKYSPLKAILVSSILFGVLHLNPWQFVAALIAGIFSGWVYYETKKLTLSILIHFVNNLVAFGSTYFLGAESYSDESLTELYGGFLNFTVITLGAVIVTVICLYLLMQEIASERSKNDTNILE